MVRIRLAKYGRKSLPFYRIVVIDSRKKQNGKYIEMVGTYDPVKKNVSINTELYLKHLSYGAQPSETVSSLFKNYSKKQSENNTITK